MTDTQLDRVDDSRKRPVKAPRFTLADADRAYEEWGANCGPGAFAAIMGMTLDEARPHLIGFEAKGYTNPTMMFGALKSVGATWRTTQLKHHSEISQPSSLAHLIKFPRYGLARIQWEGPWTGPDVPIPARYRCTHWVGSAHGKPVNSLNLQWCQPNIGIFDINCMNNGSGWCSVEDWTSTIAPHLIAQYPRANGKWHITHAIEVKPS